LYTKQEHPLKMDLALDQVVSWFTSNDTLHLHLHSVN